VVIPTEFVIKTLRIALQVGLDLSESKQHRLNDIIELDKIYQVALQHTALVKQQRAKWHDRFIKKNKFREGEWALMFDSQYK
jgi:hypothetical protein